MKTLIEKRCVVAEACGLKGPWKMELRQHRYRNPKGEVLAAATIDSIRSAVLMQSEEFQAKFAWQLECTCVKLNFSKPNLYYVHKLTPSDWLNAFVETVEAMKKL